MQVSNGPTLLALDLPSYQFFGDPTNKSETYYSFRLQEDLQKGFSLLTASTASSTLLCNSVLDARCSGNGLRYQAEAVLPRCTETETSYCIEGIEAEISRGEFKAMQFSRYIDADKFSSEGSSGLPEPSTISLWELPTSAGILKFATLATLSSYGQSGSTPVKFEPTRLQVQLNQFEERALGVASRLSARETVDSQGVKNYTWSPLIHTGTTTCVWNELGRCGAAQVMPKDLNFSITIRIPKELPGWIYGRISGADMSLNTTPKQWNILNVSGTPAETMGISAGTSLSDATPTMKSWIGSMKPFSGNAVTVYESSDSGDSAGLRAFKDVLRDTGTLMFTRWSFYINKDVNLFSGTSCYENQNSILGFVSTNAPIYSGRPPTFVGGLLTYKVLGLHFKPNGEVFRGTYNLILESKFARCLYGFTNAPIQASVQVLSENGENSVAVTTFSESNDGWIKFSANGFTFSSPTIKIRLSQAISVSSTPAPKPIVRKKSITTIFCQNKKIVKKISAINPKCPVGYKKLN